VLDGLRDGGLTKLAISIISPRGLTLSHFSIASQTRSGVDRAAARRGKVPAVKIRISAMPGAFEPEAIAAMSEAFEAACEVLHNAGPPEVVREIVAGRIIAAARFGERDPAHLRVAALAGRQIG
jgi:hypothetical protein